MGESSASPLEVTPAWLESIDAVYALFEDPGLKNKFGDLAVKVQNAVKLCEQVVQELGLEKCALSFNGGKDCTVIVHILAAVLRRLYVNSTSQPSSSTSSPPLVPVPSVYITCPSPFPILEAFIRASQVRYNLDIYTVPGGMKEGLEEYFDGGGDAGVPEVSQRSANGADETAPRQRTVPGRQRRDIKAIFIGTRSTDPGGDSLEPRKWTDPSWPSVERIHPILDWTYADVWAFLRCTALGARSDTKSNAKFNGNVPATTQQDAECNFGTAGGGSEGVPYCVLYDQGYTSLGSTFNTFPNPLLRREELEHSPVFNPAWQLGDASSERAGRGDKPRTSDKS